MTTNPASAEVDAHLATHTATMRKGPKLDKLMNDEQSKLYEVGQVSCASCGRISTAVVTACICGCTTLYPCLAVGEELEDGDEVYRANIDQWVKVRHLTGPVITSGTFRRPIPSPAPDATVRYDATGQPRVVAPDATATPRTDEKEWEGVSRESAIRQANHFYDAYHSVIRALDAVKAELAAAQRTNADLRAKLEEANKRYGVAHTKGCAIAGELVVCEQDRDALRSWKREALTVESWWQRIDDFVRKHPDAKLGRGVADTALAFLAERDSLKARLLAVLEQKEGT